MFERATYVKILIIAIAVAIAYNYLAQMGRETDFMQIPERADKAAVWAALGNAKSAYSCKDSPAGAAYFEAQFCADSVHEVQAFTRCLITQLCPGYYYVAFNEAGKMTDKYKYAAPLFESGGENR